MMLQILNKFDFQNAMQKSGNCPTAERLTPASNLQDDRPDPQPVQQRCRRGSGLFPNHVKS